jgi:DNA-binding NarL/FixJ family response regulator
MISQDVTLGGWRSKRHEAQGSTMNKIIVADSQALFRAAIAKVLASEEDFRVAAQCADLERLLLSVDAYRSSIVLFASALRLEHQDLMSHVKAAGSRAVVIAENGEPAQIFTAHDCSHSPGTAHPIALR